MYICANSKQKVEQTNKLTQTQTDSQSDSKLVAARDFFLNSPEK